MRLNLTDPASITPIDLVDIGRDAQRYRWLRQHWARVITHTEIGIGEIRYVVAIDLGPEGLGTIDEQSLDGAIDLARGAA